MAADKEQERWTELDEQRERQLLAETEADDLFADAPTEAELMKEFDTEPDEAEPYDPDDSGHDVDDWRDYHAGLGVL